MDPPYTFETSGSLARIMGIGSLKLKVIVKNGDPPGEMVSKLGGATLGIPWIPIEDKMWIMLSVNLLARKKSCPALEEVIVDRLEEIDQIVLTPRICLGLVMSLYDPLGLISPLTFRLKKLIQEQSTPSIGGG